MEKVCPFCMKAVHDEKVLAEHIREFHVSNVPIGANTIMEEAAQTIATLRAELSDLVNCYKGLGRKASRYEDERDSNAELCSYWEELFVSQCDKTYEVVVEMETLRAALKKCEEERDKAKEEGRKIEYDRRSGPSLLKQADERRLHTLRIACALYEDNKKLQTDLTACREELARYKAAMEPVVELWGELGGKAEKLWPEPKASFADKVYQAIREAVRWLGEKDG